MSKPSFYIHLGLPKTATTFLQETIFSQFDKKDISFLGKAKNVSIWDIMDMPSNKYLISSEHLLANPFTCEKGQWLNDFKKNLMKLYYKFPEAKYILTLRKHEKLILSYYKEHISKGNRSHYPKLKEFYDINNDAGQVSQNDFYFQNLIEEIISVTGTSPLVIMQNQFKTELNKVIHILDFFLEIPSQQIKFENKKKINIGVESKKSKWLIQLNKFHQMSSKFGLNFYAPFFKKAGLTPDYIVRKRLAWVTDKPLKLPLEMERFIQEKYKEDLKWVEEYIENQNLNIFNN